MALIKLEGVNKTYQLGRVSVQALKNIDLEVEEGDFLVVLGPSGSGKTTLLNIVGGIDRPTSGSVTVNGQRIDEFNDTRLTEYRRLQVGFVFQFFNLIPTLTAAENVQYAIDLVKKDKKVTRSAKELLELVGLSERATHFPFNLSGGEQQRVAVARALAKDTPIILCDEPTGELDFKTGKKILKLMRELNRKENKTFMVVTHNTVVGRIADRVIHLHDGEIARIEKVENPIDPEDIEW